MTTPTELRVVCRDRPHLLRAPKCAQEIAAVEAALRGAEVAADWLDRSRRPDRACDSSRAAESVLDRAVDVLLAAISREYPDGLAWALSGSRDVLVPAAELDQWPTREQVGPIADRLRTALESPEGLRIDDAQREVSGLSPRARQSVWSIIWSGPYDRPYIDAWQGVARYADVDGEEDRDRELRVAILGA